ncbi:MAG: MATE family efflux transporter [Clostridiales bacterium]|nr:MATE family efflux transporter [Clostridiales bacterium]
MNKNQDLLERASYPKLLLNLCLPTIIIMLVMVVYNMADTLFIGQTGDPAKIAALSLCGPVFSILSGLGTLLGSGGCTVISLALGRGETNQIRACTSLCCYGSLVLGGVILAVLTIGANPVALLLGADAETLSYVMGYMRIIGIGAPVIMFNNVFCNIIRADGAAVESMISNLLGTVSNIVLDAVFILGLSMDVEGAALATVLGNAFSSCYLLYYILRKQPAFSLHPKYLSLNVLPSILSLGLPLACSTLLMSVSNIVANNRMIAYGSVALAAQGVAGKAGMLLSMLLMGICMGLQPAISFNHARGNQARVGQIIRSTAVFTTLLGSVIALLCFLFRHQIIALFIDNAEVIAYGSIMIFASIVIGPFYGLYQLCQTFLQSTGKASYATLVALMDKGIFYLPILLLMDRLFGMYGIAFASAVTLVFSIAAGVFFSLRWNRKLAQEAV